MKTKLVMALACLLIAATACKTTVKQYHGPYRFHDTNKPDSHPTYTLEEIESGVVWFIIYPIPYVKTTGVLLCEEDKSGNYDLKCK